MKKAVLFGASGFVGSYLLESLLNNADYEQIIVIVRKPLNINHQKLKVLIGDYDSLKSLKDNIIVDEVFIALGTTKKKTPALDKYYQIDHDYPVLAAKLAKENGAKSVFLVSAVSANVHSNIFYVRTKGETERDIIALDFKHTHIFRPSMIMGNRKESRPLEKIIIKIWTIINPIFIGKLSCYKGIHAKAIATAMRRAGQSQLEKVTIYNWKKMQRLLRN
jgi:uncharacterized protein YbjT (DUF2867 family)